MKKNIPLWGLCFLLFLLPFRQFAQLTDNDYAPNWTLTDMNGQSHTLHSYLDQNKSVVLFFFDAGNPPSWAYQATNSLQNLHTQQGDSAVVIYIESNLLTTDDNLHGNVGMGQPSSITLGDWVTGNPCPIVNLSSDTLLTRYQITNLPVVMTICPARVVRISGQRTAAQHQELIGTCPGLATDSVDLVYLKYYGPAYLCNEQLNHARYLLQNRGTQTITAGLSRVLYVSSQFLFLNYNWTANLKTYETIEITLPVFDDSYDGLTVFQNYAANQGEVDYSDNHIYESLGLDYYPVYDTLMNLEIVTDQYGDEITWELVQSNGLVAFKGGPYPKLANPGTAIYNIPLDLVKEECYKFSIKDKYGDGMCCNYGNGHFKLSDANGKIAVEGDTAFLEKTAYISAGGIVGVDKFVDFKGFALSMYPIPSSDVLNINILSPFTDNMQAEIRNVLGQSVKFFSLENPKSEIDIHDLPSGTYNLQVSLKNQAYNFKFIKVE